MGFWLRKTYVAPGERPAAPTISLSSYSDNGASNIDKLTNDTEPRFSWTFDSTFQAGHVLKIYQDEGLIASHTVTSQNILDGLIPITTGVLADGVYNFTGTVSNGSGESDHSNIETVTISTDEIGPISVSLSPTTDSGVLGDDSTAYTQPSLLMEFSAPFPSVGDTVVIREGATVLATRVLTGSELASVTIQVDSALVLGSHSIFAYAYTVAGGFSPITNYTLTVQNTDIYIVAATPPGMFNGYEFAGFDLEVVNGEAPYTWSVHAGTIPTGLSLNSSTGSFTGTPSAPGNFTGTIRVTDNNGIIDDLDFNWTVHADYSPLVVFGSDLKLWIDPAAPSGHLYQEVAMSTAVTTAGQTVGGVNDRSSNNLDLTAAGDNTTRPTYNTTDFANIRFDGSNDTIRHMTTPIDLYGSAVGWSAFFSGKFTAGDNKTLFVDRGSNGNPFVQINVEADGDLQAHIRLNSGGVSANRLQIGTGIADGTAKAVGVVYDGTQFKVYVNGVLNKATAFAKTTALTAEQFFVGSQGGVANSYPAMDLAQLYVVRRQPTTFELTQTLDYIAAKVGI